MVATKKELVTKYVKELTTKGKIEVKTGKAKREDFKLCLDILACLTFDTSKVKTILNKCTIVLL